MLNLLQETQQALQDNHRLSNDIIFIGSQESGHSCTWEEFKALADQEYDNNDHHQIVARDLVIIFDDGGKLYRYECDSFDEWAYSPAFKAPEKSLPITSLLLRQGVGFRRDRARYEYIGDNLTIEEINEPPMCTRCKEEISNGIIQDGRDLYHVACFSEKLKRFNRDILTETSRINEELQQTKDYCDWLPDLSPIHDGH